MLPDINEMQVVHKGNPGSYTDPYENMTVVIVNHDGRMSFTYRVYEHIGEPEFIKILRSDDWLVFEAGSDSRHFKVQGGKRGKKRGKPSLHVKSVSANAGLCRPGYKSIYRLTLRDGRAYLHLKDAAIDVIKTPVVNRSKRSR